MALLTACTPPGLVLRDREGLARDRAAPHQQVADAYGQAGAPGAARQAQDRADAAATRARQEPQDWLSVLLRGLLDGYLDSLPAPAQAPRR